MLDSDRCENKQADQGKCYNASTSGEKVLYDDESRIETKRINKKERKEVSRGRSGLVLRGRLWIPCVIWLSFVGSCSRINPIVKYGGYL